MKKQLAPAFSAIDLGTNNCRLLIAVPHKSGFRVIDAYSKIVRLGEGLSQSDRLSDAAMDRTIDALGDCARKMTTRQVTASRNIATEACRAASNGRDFLGRIKAETGITFDIVSPGEEASLSVRGCADLIAPDAKAVLVFDIGGGSTELSWLRTEGGEIVETAAWVSIPDGVVSLAERHPGTDITAANYEAIAEEIVEALEEVDVPTDIRDAFAAGEAHLVGTSGTMTSMAGVHLGLEAYSRRAVDGLWMTAAEGRAVADALLHMPLEKRAASPCIGRDRADLVVGGCAILEGILRAYPAERIRVGDRGLREGLLLDLIIDWRAAQKSA